MTKFTDWEPAWGGILRRFPANNVPSMEQAFEILRSEIDAASSPPRETVFEWKPVGSPEGWAYLASLARRQHGGTA